MSWRRKTIFVYGVVLSLLMGLFIAGLWAQASGMDEITGYVINNGTVPVYTQQLATYEIDPFIYSAQSAQQYLDNTKYTTDLSFKKIYIMTQPFDIYTPNNLGCVFLFTSDGYSYYVAAHSLGQYTVRHAIQTWPYYEDIKEEPKCDAKVPDGPGFSKQNFLSIEILATS